MCSVIIRQTHPKECIATGKILNRVVTAPDPKQCYVSLRYSRPPSPVLEQPLCHPTFPSDTVCCFSGIHFRLIKTCFGQKKINHELLFIDCLQSNLLQFELIFATSLDIALPHRCKDSSSLLHFTTARLRVNLANSSSNRWKVRSR